ncbi:calcium-binding protein [Sphingobium limneticum]|uniref:calcium-binding protein n=1 Tax=Sphingobium limneticum TaxID=1007511 RepID=UPI00123D1019|nr:calcium-binding protein [Sphingobium limneticum]KAA9013036.1 calcium-binding protein [Sphingobium limneticum]
MSQNYVGGNAGDNDIQSSGRAGTILNGQAGDDILRGSRGDDILTGGSGNDQLWGGDGADQFRFFGNNIGGASDTDKIYDLDFSEGDTLVFGNYGSLQFSDAAGINAFNGGAAAQVSSWAGLVHLVEASDLASVSRKGQTDVLILTLDNGDGQIQNIHITGGWAAYSAAATVDV